MSSGIGGIFHRIRFQWPGWSALELSRRWAGYCREAGLDAIARTARLGDALAAVENPANRIGPLVAQHAAAGREQAQERLARWLVKGLAVDLRA